MKTLIEFYEKILPEEKVIADALITLIRDRAFDSCKMKFSYGVPFFYDKKGIAIIWPASIPKGGIKKGVLLGFWQGNKLKDPQCYLMKGNNKKVYYKIFEKPEDLDIKALTLLIDEALTLDQGFK